MVLAQLVRAAGNRRLLRRMLKIDRANEAAERAAYGRTQKQLRQAEAAADRLLEAFASGALPMTEATTRKYREIAGRVAGLTIGVEKLKAKLAHAQGQEREAQIQETLRRLPERLRKAAPGQRRALVAGLVSRVWIDDAGGVSACLSVSAARISADSPAHAMEQSRQERRSAFNASRETHR